MQIKCKLDGRKLPRRVLLYTRVCVCRSIRGFVSLFAILILPLHIHNAKVGAVKPFRTLRPGEPLNMHKLRFMTRSNPDLIFLLFSNGQLRMNQRNDPPNFYIHHMYMLLIQTGSIV